jgi:NUDIX domain
MRTAINLISIQDKKILLFKKKKVWILPGGKPKKHEKYFSCLTRECAEEIPEAKITIGKKYGNFVDKTPHRGDLLKAKAFLGSVAGKIDPGGEILKTGYFSKKQTQRLKTSAITKKIIEQLALDNYL